MDCVSYLLYIKYYVNYILLLIKYLQFVQLFSLYFELHCIDFTFFFLYISYFTESRDCISLCVLYIFLIEKKLKQFSKTIIK